MNESDTVTGYHVPLVLRYRSWDDVVDPPSDGYHPHFSVNLAEAHRWVPYKDLLSMLRYMMLAFEFSDYSVRQLHTKFLTLYSTGSPFSATRRFPYGDVYVCLDRSPLNEAMIRIQQVLASSRSSGIHKEDYRDYYKVISDAMELLTKGEDGSFPFIFSRSLFESAFSLSWME